MLSFDFDFEGQALQSQEQHKTALARRLQKTQKSAYLPQTYSRSIFNQDNLQESEYYNHNPNHTIQDQVVSQKCRAITQRRRSKKKTIKLESLVQANSTQVYENYIKCQKEPQFQQFTVQNSIMDLQIQSKIHETRRMAKRRQNQKIDLQAENNLKLKLAQPKCIQQENCFTNYKLPQTTDPFLQNNNKTKDNNKSQLIKNTALIEKNLQKEQIFAALEQKSQQEIDLATSKPQIDEGLKDFQSQQLQKSCRETYSINCLLVRDKSGLNFFWPQFHLYSSSNREHIMSAKKTSTKPTSTFILSTSKTNFQQNSQFYLGKMKSNILGNVLNIFGTGLSPSNAQEKMVSPRELIASVVYNTDIFRGRPKQFKVYIKKPQYNYYSDFPQVEMYKDEISLNELYEFVENKQKIKVYQNRRAFWSEIFGGYMLNFKGRAKTASSKNFILEQNQSKLETVLFGKINNQNFNLDISSPALTFIAFAVALSSFDSRICD